MKRFGHFSINIFPLHRFLIFLSWHPGFNTLPIDLKFGMSDGKNGTNDTKNVRDQNLFKIEQKMFQSKQKCSTENKNVRKEKLLQIELKVVISV